MPKVTLIGAAWLVLVMPAFGQNANAAAGTQPKATQATGDNAPAYEVVSIRPNKTGSGSAGTRLLPDGFVWTNMPISMLVYGSYGIRADGEVLGLPDWARWDRYDIIAKVDAETAERWKKLSFNERLEDERPMRRSILADRCHLRAHQETRELPVYDLVIAKGGLRMKESPPNEGEMETAHEGHMIAHAEMIDAIVSQIARRGRLIVDKTGLGDKKFDFELNWTPEDRPPTDDSAPSLLTALEEQLGLKLVPSRGQVKVLIIDHMERPSPN